MELNFFRRSMVFGTFLGAFLCIGLIVASLATTHWIDARARKTANPLESESLISLGLFKEHKAVLVGLQWRYDDFSVMGGTHPARRWAWLGTAVLLLGALACAVAACLFAVFGSLARACCSPIPLLIANTFAMLFILGAIAVWLTEYFLKLQYNVMSLVDIADGWSSDGMADLGMSYWLVVGAAISAFMNDILVLIAMANE